MKPRFKPAVAGLPMPAVSGFGTVTQFWHKCLCLQPCSQRAQQAQLLHQPTVAPACSPHPAVSRGALVLPKVAGPGHLTAPLPTGADSTSCSPRGTRTQHTLPDRGLLKHPGEPLLTPAANSITENKEKPLRLPYNCRVPLPAAAAGGGQRGGHRRARVLAALPAPLAPAACGFGLSPYRTHPPVPANLPGEGGGGKRGAAPPKRGAPRPSRAAPLPPCRRRARSRRPPRRDAEAGRGRRRAEVGRVAGGAVGAGPGRARPAAPRCAGAAPGLAWRHGGWQWRGSPVPARRLTLPRLPPRLSASAALRPSPRPRGEFRRGVKSCARLPPAASVRRCVQGVLLLGLKS